MIVGPDRQLFEDGIALYASRPDKDWSLTDCISFVVMRRDGITEALTADHHFEQAGFVPFSNDSRQNSRAGALEPITTYPRRPGDDLFDDLFDEIDFSRGGRGPHRGQALFRVAFGVLGIILSAAGVVRSLTYPSPHFRVAAAVVFLALGCFCLFNIALARPWRWPPALFALSLVALFVVRVALGP